jgi:hypothetical protein
MYGMYGTALVLNVQFTLNSRTQMWRRCTVDFEADINQSILNSTGFFYRTGKLKIISMEIFKL